MKHFTNLKFDISVSTKTFENKNEISWKDVRYKRFDDLSIDNFLNKITKGHTFCYVFNDNDKIFGQSVKTKENFKYTNLIAVDVDDSPIAMNDYLSKIHMQPTIAYTTQNDSEDKHRFRLIYFFEEKISDVHLYVILYRKIVSMLEDYTGVEMQDNCMCSVNQQFAGNARKDIYLLFNKIEYNINDFAPFKIKEKFVKNERKQDNSQIKVTKLNLSEEFLNDIQNMTDLDFIEKYSSKYTYEMETPVKFNDKGYALIHDEFYQVKHKFNYNMQVVKYQIGEDRKLKLFIIGLTILKINPNITDENLLYDLIIERCNFFDNSDDKLNTRYLLDLAKGIRNQEDNIIQPIPKKFKIDTKGFYADKIERYAEAFCNYRVALNKVVAQVKNLIKKEEVAKYYDSNKSMKENHKIINDKGVKISLSRLYVYAEELEAEKSKEQK